MVCVTRLVSTAESIVRAIEIYEDARTISERIVRYRQHSVHDTVSTVSTIQSAQCPRCSQQSVKPAYPVGVMGGQDSYSIKGPEGQGLRSGYIRRLLEGDAIFND